MCEHQGSLQWEGVKAEDYFPWLLGLSRSTGQWRLSIWHRHTVCLVFSEEQEPNCLFLIHFLKE